MQKEIQKEDWRRKEWTLDSGHRLLSYSFLLGVPGKNFVA